MCSARLLTRCSPGFVCRLAAPRYPCWLQKHTAQMLVSNLVTLLWLFTLSACRRAAPRPSPASRRTHHTPAKLQSARLLWISNLAGGPPQDHHRLPDAHITPLLSYNWPDCCGSPTLQAGRPKTITGFQTHTTPVLLSVGERAELGTEKYTPGGLNFRKRFG